MERSNILLSQMHPICRVRAIACYNQAIHATQVNVHPVIDQTGRTFAESAADWQKGRNAAGIVINQDEVVSNAKPGTSRHNYYLALDFHLVINGKDYWPANAAEALANENWMIVVKIFESAGFNSGLYFPGTFKDAPHLEYKGGYTINQLLAKYNAGDFIKGTSYLNL